MSPKFLITSLIVLLLAFGFIVCESIAQLPTDVDETYVSFNYDKIITDTGWAGGFGFPVKLSDNIAGYGAGILQASDIIRGRYHAELTYTGLSLVDLTFYADGTVRGPELNALGNNSDFGVNFNTPDIKRENSEIDIGFGIFGRSGGAFAKANALDDLVGLAYAEGDLEGYTNAEGKGLADLNPAPTGLSFHDRKSLNGLGYIRYNHNSGLGVNFKLLPEIVNDDGSEAIDQGILAVTYSVDLNQRFNLQGGVEYGIQRYRDSGNTETESAVSAAIVLKL